MLLNQQTHLWSVLSGEEFAKGFLGCFLEHHPENQEICSQKQKKVTQKQVVNVLQFSNRTRLIKLRMFCGTLQSASPVFVNQMQKKLTRLEIVLCCRRTLCFSVQKAMIVLRSAKQFIYNSRFFSSGVGEVCRPLFLFSKSSHSQLCCGFENKKSTEPVAH
jgi:hypothetical protein